jgi:hypothetical protein
MADDDNPRDPAQLSLGGIVANLPAVRRLRRRERLRRALLLLTLLLTTCAPLPKGDVPDPHRFQELVPGVSTTDDAIAKLGQPRSYTDIGHDRILLQWWDYYAPNPIHLAISFRADNRRMIAVQSVTMP